MGGCRIVCGRASRVRFTRAGILSLLQEVAAGQDRRASALTARLGLLGPSGVVAQVSNGTPRAVESRASSNLSPVFAAAGAAGGFGASGILRRPRRLGLRGEFRTVVAGELLLLELRAGLKLQAS